MTLTDFAAQWGLTVKYCDLTLTTGANDGSSWANAWRTFADVMAGELAGTCVAFKSRSISYTTMIDPTVAGTYAQYIVWVAVDDSDNVVDENNWGGYGGSVGVVIDMTGAGGTVDGMKASNGKTYRHFYGFTILNAGRNGIYAYGSESLWRFCKTKSCGTRGIYEQASAKGLFSNCIVENETYGAYNVAGTQAVFEKVWFKNCVVGFAGSGRGVVTNCVFDGCTRAIDAFYNTTIMGCSFYNCSMGIRTGTATPNFVFNCSFSDCGDCLTNNAGQYVLYIMKNLRYYNVTNFIVSVAVDIQTVDIEDQSAEVLTPIYTDPANGDFTSIPQDGLSGDFKFNSLTHSYDQAGLIQLASASGGGGGGLKPNFPQLNVQRW